MNTRWQEIPFGGMDLAIEPPPGAASSIINMVHDPEGYWQVGPGTTQVAPWSLFGGPVTALTWFNPQPGVAWLVAEIADVSSGGGAQLAFYDWTSPGWVMIYAPRRRVAGVWTPGRLVQLGQWLYHFNGLEMPIRWPGRSTDPQYTSPMGFTRAAASPRAAGMEEGWTQFDVAAAVIGATITVTEGTQRGVGEFPHGTEVLQYEYAYAAVWVNDLGQMSPPSPLVYIRGQNDASLNNGRHSPKLEMTAAPDYVRGCILLRSRNLAGASVTTAPDLYVHSAFATGAEWHLVDLLTDNELGELFDQSQVGPTPLGVVTGVSWQNTTWLLTKDGHLYRSAPLFPEQFPADNIQPVGGQVAGAGTGLVVVGEALVIFRERGTYLVKGNPVEGYRIETLSEEIGCPAPRSAVNLPGLGLLFLSESGPYVLRGALTTAEPTALQPIKGIRKIWRALVGKELLRTAFAIHDPDQGEVWWQVPLGGDARPQRAIVYHYDVGGWSFRVGYTIACAARAWGKTWVGSWDDTGILKHGVHLLTYASPTVFGVTQQGSYTTGPIRSDAAPEDRTSLHQVRLRALGLGTAPTIAVSYRHDRDGAGLTSQTEDPIQEVHPEHDRDAWGTGLWGSGIWSDYDLALMPVSTYKTNGFEHQFSFVATRMRVVGLDMGWDPGSHRGQQARERAR